MNLSQTFASHPALPRALTLALVLFLPLGAGGEESPADAAPAISGDQVKALESASGKLAEADAMLREHKIRGLLVNGTLKMEIPVTKEAKLASPWLQPGLQTHTLAQRVGNHLVDSSGSADYVDSDLLHGYAALAGRCEQLEREKTALAKQLESARKHIADLLGIINASTNGAAQPPK